jgi:hypothetical protein
MTRSYERDVSPGVVLSIRSSRAHTNRLNLTGTTPARQSYECGESQEDDPDEESVAEHMGS